MSVQYGNLVVCAILIVLAAGCGSAAKVTPASPSSTAGPTKTASAPEPGSVVLQFIGNSCTVIAASDGTRIVSDPYGDYEHPAGIGPLPKDLTANAVTVSHAHPDHNSVKSVGGSPQVIMEAGTYQIGKIKVTGYAGFEGSPSGPSQNPHVVFVFEADGVKIVHMGDSGPITDPDILSAVENADVILFNIDGYVIPAEQIVPFLQQVKARTWIATHYSLREDARWQNAPTIDEFVKTLPSDLPVIRLGSEIVVTPNMPDQAAVLTSLAVRK